MASSSLGARKTSVNFEKVDNYPRNEDGSINRSDPVAIFEARAMRARERAVAIEQTKMLKEQLRQCYYKEGVNHYENCKDIAESYLKRITASNFGALVTFFQFHFISSDCRSI